MTLYPAHPEWGELFDLKADRNEHVNLFRDAALRGVRAELARALQRGFPAMPGVDAELIARW